MPLCAEPRTQIERLCLERMFLGLVLPVKGSMQGPWETLSHGIKVLPGDICSWDFKLYCSLNL